MTISIKYLLYNVTSTPDHSPLSLHDALPISMSLAKIGVAGPGLVPAGVTLLDQPGTGPRLAAVAFQRFWTLRSEEHTSELQSRGHVVCRLLLEKKKACHWLGHG